MQFPIGLNDEIVLIKTKDQTVKVSHLNYSVLGTNMHVGARIKMRLEVNIPKSYCHYENMSIQIY